MDRRTQSKKWLFLVPTSALLGAILLLYLLYPNSLTRQTWDGGKLHTGSQPIVGLDSQDGVAADPMTGSSDVSFRLHPEQHSHREAKTIELEWNITKANRRPDGVNKDVYLINGQFGGPAIELRSGDELIVTIRNQLRDEGVAIHWHGLRIANEMDGVVGLTQCPTKSGQGFTYHLVIPDDQHGTFWYHSHSETQRADGLFGPLIVHKPVDGSQIGSEMDQFEYEDDQVLLIGDWYHDAAGQVLQSYLDWKNFKIEPAPDSMLLNGQGYFNCSQATEAKPVDCTHAQVPEITLSNRTRLRVVNVGALTGFTISTMGYAMTLIKVDGGHLVEAVSSERIGVLYPGERIDVVIERRTDEVRESGWITIALDRENMAFPNLALSDTQQFIIVPHLNSAETPHRTPAPIESRSMNVPWIDLRSINGSNSIDDLPQLADETILVYATISYLTEFEYRPKGFINHTSWLLDAESPPLLAVDRMQWPEDPAPFVIAGKQGSWIDVVVNNLDDKGHPFHLHGHDFYVIAVHRPTRTGAFQQYNPFDPKQPAMTMNLAQPLLKDTVYVPSMGYVVLRFKATSPGLWMLHCHVLWHEAVGMNMAIQIGGDANPTLKETAARSCGG